MCGYCIEAALCCNFFEEGAFILPSVLGTLLGTLGTEPDKPCSLEACYALYESPDPKQLLEP